MNFTEIFIKSTYNPKMRVVEPEPVLLWWLRLSLNDYVNVIYFSSEFNIRKLSFNYDLPTSYTRESQPEPLQ